MILSVFLIQLFVAMFTAYKNGRFWNVIRCICSGLRLFWISSFTEINNLTCSQSASLDLLKPWYVSSGNICYSENCLSPDTEQYRVPMLRVKLRF